MLCERPPSFAEKEAAEARVEVLRLEAQLEAEEEANRSQSLGTERSGGSPTHSVAGGTQHVQGQSEGND